MIVAAVRAFVVEYADHPPRDQGLLESLNRNSDIPAVLNYSNADDCLKNEALWLLEVRNEILHPAHLATGTKDNFPQYLRPLKEKGVLQSSGKPDSDYVLLMHFASQKLFTWSIGVARKIVNQVLASHPEKRKTMADIAGNFERIM